MSHCYRPLSVPGFAAVVSLVGEEVSDRAFGSERFGSVT